MWKAVCRGETQHILESVFLLVGLGPIGLLCLPLSLALPSPVEPGEL